MLCKIVPILNLVEKLFFDDLDQLPSKIQLECMMNRIRLVRIWWNLPPPPPRLRDLALKRFSLSTLSFVGFYFYFQGAGSFELSF